MPFLVFGFDWKVLFWAGVFTTFIGTLNHTNIKLDYGLLKYILNSPSVHIFHHDIKNHFKNGQNFGVALNLWDYLFGTIYYKKDTYPKELGFKGDANYNPVFIKKNLF